MALHVTERVMRFITQAERTGLLEKLRAEVDGIDASRRNDLSSKKKQIQADFGREMKGLDAEVSNALQAFDEAKKALELARRKYVVAFGERMGLSVGWEQKLLKIENELLTCVPTPLAALVLTIEQFAESTRSARYRHWAEKSWLTGKLIYADNGHGARVKLLERLVQARHAADAAKRSLPSEECAKFVETQVAEIAKASEEALDGSREFEQLFADNLKQLSDNAT